MKFDVVIGNPPYQDGTKNIYNRFIDKAMQLEPYYLIMIVKNNWMTSDTLRGTRSRMIAYGISDVINYPNVGEVFPDVSVAVNIFRLIKGYTGKLKYSEMRNNKLTESYESKIEFPYIIVSNQKEQSIIVKVAHGMHGNSLSKGVYSQGCFGIDTNFLTTDREKFPLPTSEIKYEEYDVEVACLYGKSIGYKYMIKQDIPSHQELIPLYKLVCGRVVNNNAMVLSNINILEKNTACNLSLSVIYSSLIRQEVELAYKYVKTRFVRFMIKILCVGSMMGLTPYPFSIVPLQDFTESSDIDWTQSVSDIDQQLYKKYNLTPEEIDYIEKTIKPME